MDVFDVNGSIVITARAPRVAGGDATAVVIRRSQIQIQSQRGTQQLERNFDECLQNVDDASRPRASRFHPKSELRRGLMMDARAFAGAVVAHRRRRRVGITHVVIIMFHDLILIRVQLGAQF